MLDFAAIQLPDPDADQRFCIVLRGEYMLLQGDDGRTAQMGFYVVRTASAGDQATAKKVALFDLEAEIRIKDLGSVPEHLAVEMAKRLDDDQEDVNSDFIFYPMDADAPV